MMKTEPLEAQSRRKNLRFYGFNDKSDESEAKKQNYIDEHLNIDGASIQIKKAHSIWGQNSPRPIIVKFLHYKDREYVHKAYREKTMLTRLRITIQMKKV